MSNHTPGPWKVSHQDQHGQTVVKAEHIEVATCWHHCVGSIEKEMHANARLISAAPDLLDALQEAISMLGSRLIKDTFGYEWHEKATSAIAKATGETK